MDSSMEDEQTRNSTTPASPWTCRISRSVQPREQAKVVVRGGREWSRRATQVSDLAASCPEKSRTSSLSVQASPFKETLSVPLNRSWPAFRANTCYERRRFTRSNDPAWNGHDLDLLEDHRFKAVPLLS